MSANNDCQMSFGRQWDKMLRGKCSMFAVLALILQLRIDTGLANNKDEKSTSGNNNIANAASTDNVDSRDYLRDDTSGTSYEDEDWLTYRDRVINDAITRLSNATSVEDVLSLGFLDKGERPLSSDDLSASYNNKTGKLLINGKGELAAPDQCSPREVTEEVNVTGIPADTVLFPKCIKVRKCGGCCSVSDVVCQPTETEKVVFNLIKLSVSKGSKGAHVTGVYPLGVTQHTKCRCSCSLSETSCGPFKTFNSKSCSCHCNATANNVRCSPPHFFDIQTCQCECAERPQCCPQGVPCEFSFNERSCTCDVGKMVISSSTNVTINQLEDFFKTMESQTGITKNSIHSEGRILHSTTASSITSTTAASTNQCRGIRCPVQFETKVTKDGLCTWSRIGRGRHRNQN